VIRAKAPTYRKQHSFAANALGRSDGSEQVRYWSLCSVVATRPVDCLRDENVIVDDRGFFDVVIAPACPVAGYRNCLRAGRSDSGNTFYRNTLPSESFYNEHGPRECPAGHESVFCGDYAPKARYVPRDCAG
jgi:hypothetical protein